MSTGAACIDSGEPSYVLSALGIDKEISQCAIRVGFGRFNTEQEVEYAAKKISEIVLK